MKRMRKLISIGLIVVITAILSTACISTSQKYQGTVYLGDMDNGSLINISWSPTDDKIAITSHNDARNYSKIYILDVNTREINQLLETTYGSITVSGWSPDGKRLLFYSADGGKEFKPGIWLYNIDGKATPEFISEGFSAAWSPLGNKLAVFEIERKFQIWDISLHIRNLNSTKDEVVYTTRGKYIYGLSWSPDGTRLAFALAQEGLLENVNIYNLDIASGELIQLTEVGINSSPTWSPKGDLIAYIIKESNGDTKLYIQKSDGSCGFFVPNLKKLSHPTWSPDGRYIAFIGEPGGVYKLDLVKAFGDKYLSDGLTCQ